MKKIDSGKYFSKALKKKLIILVGIVLVTTGVLIYLGVQINSEAREIENIRRESKSILKSFDALSLISMQREEAESLYDSLTTAIPEEFDIVVSAPRRLRELAAEKGLRAQVDIGNRRDGSPPSVELKIKADGQLNNIIDYIEALENEPQFFVVESFSVSRLGATSDMQLTASVWVSIESASEEE